MGGPGREDCHERRRGAPAVASLSAVALGTGCDLVGTLTRATGSVGPGVWKPGESAAMRAGPVPWPWSSHRRAGVEPGESLQDSCVDCPPWQELPAAALQPWATTGPVGCGSHVSPNIEVRLKRLPMGIELPPDQIDLNWLFT